MSPGQTFGSSAILEISDKRLSFSLSAVLGKFEFERGENRLIEEIIVEYNKRQANLGALLYYNSQQRVLSNRLCLCWPSLDYICEFMKNMEIHFDIFLQYTNSLYKDLFLRSNTKTTPASKVQAEVIASMNEVKTYYEIKIQGGS